MFFFGFVILFIRKFFKCLQRAPFFSILQKNGCSKTPKGPSFTFFGTMRLTGDQKKSKKQFKKNSDNLKYGADLGHSRLVLHYCASAHELKTMEFANYPQEIFSNFGSASKMCISLHESCKRFLLRFLQETFEKIIFVKAKACLHCTKPCFQ